MMDIFSNTNLLLILAIFWIIPWKGYALWISARREQKWWFIILLIVNTLAILEIIYIFLIAKKNPFKKRVKDAVKEAIEEVGEDKKR
jgi:hypothetical protein